MDMMGVPERTEEYTERGLSAAFVLFASLALAVIATSFLIPTGDDLMGGGTATVPSARPRVETHRTLSERCNDRETWVPGAVRTGNGTLWDAFVRAQATRAEARYCEQWLGGQLLVEILGLGHP
jgi:hypothetical protein